VWLGVWFQVGGLTVQARGRRGKCRGHRISFDRTPMALIWELVAAHPVLQGIPIALATSEAFCRVHEPLVVLHVNPEKGVRRRVGAVHAAVVAGQGPCVLLVSSGRDLVGRRPA